ncbi:uncharacterized protein PRCAT00000579001 [Priceomyces carsonii]|uniref:uncharacterized protein n=1 Tax=Priceomyces carsonii TaxID=28549 RepID=UPI002EDA9E79|nr:unnamed protein product [Priceomyces carsonii]
MSNAETGKLYETIIEEVISDSRQDFEDSGIDESTLQDLKRIWCERLSHTQVAKFSWDEEEFNNNYDSHVIQSQQIPQSDSLTNGNLHLDGGDLELPMGSDSQLSYNTIQPDSSNSNIGIQIPSIDPQPKSEYDSSSTGLMLPRINQSDGTFEFVLYTDSGAHFLKSFKQKKKQKKIINQVDGSDDDEDDEDDDIFNDSDDINSDLDDGLESDKSDEEDGEQEGQIMLCLYDKVQRVKNKWKSSLKEGIANINGKDYVFQKATGESEW